MQPESAFTEVNGLRLHYLTWTGGASGPPIVLIHANGFLAALWQPIAEALAQRFTVHAYDVRGHGDSDKPAEGYHWQRFVDDLQGFLDRLGLRNVPLLGHSSGGAAAIYLAATRPEYVSRIAAYEPIIVPSEVPAEFGGPAQMIESARKRRQVWGSREELLEAYRSRTAFANWPDDMLRLYVTEGTFTRDDGQVQLKCPGEVEAQIFENSRSLDWDVLPDVRCPVLMMAGERTDSFLRMMMDNVAARIPGARTMTIPDAGHLGPMERSAAITAASLQFLDEP